jgi:hypothetical protein
MSEAAQTSGARLGIEERQLELTKFLMGDDPLGIVLRAHMHIEEELVAFITAKGHLKNTNPIQICSPLRPRVQVGGKAYFRAPLECRLSARLRSFPRRLL